MKAATGKPKEIDSNDQLILKLAKSSLDATKDIWQQDRKSYHRLVNRMVKRYGLSMVARYLGVSNTYAGKMAKDGED